MSGDKVDPFSAIGAAVAAGGQPPASPGNADAKEKRDAGECIMPVPDDAPQPRSSNNSKGKVEAAWAYRGPGGELLHWVCRFDHADGSKDILPQTWRTKGGRASWQWKAAPAPRPLYGLDRLALAPAAPVLVVEGEKTADAAAALFPEFVAVTWSGGGKAATRADWAPLAGRRVVILPDADQAGRDAAAAAQKAVAAAGADGAGVVTLPLDLPAGWDCADRFPDGFTLGELRGLIGEALAGASAGHLELPWGFRFDDDGLWRTETDKEGKPRDVRLSDPFEVLGEARDPEGGGWAVVIRFQDRDGRRKVKVVKRASIAAEAGAVRADLAGDGLFIHPGRGRAEHFAACLAEVAHTRRITLAKRTGWIDANRFVLPWCRWRQSACDRWIPRRRRRFPEDRASDLRTSTGSVGRPGETVAKAVRFHRGPGIPAAWVRHPRQEPGSTRRARILRSRHRDSKFPLTMYCTSRK